MKINRKILLTLFLGSTLLLNPVLGMDQAALEKKRLEKSQERKKLVRANSSPDSLRKFEGKSEQKITEQNTTTSDFELSPAPQTIGSTQCTGCKKNFDFFNKYIDTTPQFCPNCFFTIQESTYKPTQIKNNDNVTINCPEDLSCKVCSWIWSKYKYNNYQYPICSLCQELMEKWAKEEKLCWKDMEVKERLKKDSYDEKETKEKQEKDSYDKKN